MRIGNILVVSQWGRHMSAEENASRQWWGGVSCLVVKLARLAINN
ncbi:MAG: hypothetical protein ACREPR_20260 [Brasilonema sp.]